MGPWSLRPREEAFQVVTRVPRAHAILRGATTFGAGAWLCLPFFSPMALWLSWLWRLSTAVWVQDVQGVIIDDNRAERSDDAGVRHDGTCTKLLARLDRHTRFHATPSSSAGLLAAVCP